jgi:hypothetical protein
MSDAILVNAERYALTKEEIRKKREQRKKRAW